MIYLLTYLTIGVLIVLFLRKFFDALIDLAFEDEPRWEKVKPFFYLFLVLIWPVYVYMVINPYNDDEAE